MSPVAVLILLLIIALPIAWFASEFYRYRWLRIILGILAIGGCYGAAYIGSHLCTLNYNAWYGHATHDLLETSLAELDKGNTDRVRASWQNLYDDFHPTYENRARYDELVNQAVKELTSQADPLARYPLKDGDRTWIDETPIAKKLKALGFKKDDKYYSYKANLPLGQIRSLFDREPCPPPCSSFNPTYFRTTIEGNSASVELKPRKPSSPRYTGFKNLPDDTPVDVSVFLGARRGAYINLGPSPGWAHENLKLLGATEITSLSTDILKDDPTKNLKTRWYLLPDNTCLGIQAKYYIPKPQTRPVKPIKPVASHKITQIVLGERGRGPEGFDKQRITYLSKLSLNRYRKELK